MKAPSNPVRASGVKEVKEFSPADSDATTARMRKFVTQVYSASSRTKHDATTKALTINCLGKSPMTRQT